MQRPLLAKINRYNGFVPLWSMMDCVVSTIISILRVPFLRLKASSITSKKDTKAIICSGIVTFGNITTKFSGILPFASLSKVVRNKSKVRSARSFNSSVNGLILMPIKGESVPSFIPLATSCAALTAVSSSSWSGRFPKPSSKSILKSSTPSFLSLAMTF